MVCRRKYTHFKTLFCSQWNLVTVNRLLGLVAPSFQDDVIHVLRDYDTYASLRSIVFQICSSVFRKVQIKTYQHAFGTNQENS